VLHRIQIKGGEMTKLSKVEVLKFRESCERFSNADGNPYRVYLFRFVSPERDFYFHTNEFHLFSIFESYERFFNTFPNYQITKLCQAVQLRPGPPSEQVAATIQSLIAQVEQEGSKFYSFDDLLHELGDAGVIKPKVDATAALKGFYTL
jgi:hypothetical protein